jgi:imidazolonepropionase-like amidohydrolase
VLVAATKLGGELMGRDRIGMLKQGFLADLLVVHGDPTRDVRILQDQRNIALIMKDGAIYKRQPLGASHSATASSSP